MRGNKNKRDSKIRSLFDNEIFKEQLIKTRKLPDQKWNDHISGIRRRWKLSWDYHETLYEYVETGLIDYSLGDIDIRVIDYKAKTMLSSHNPSDEFNTMKTLKKKKKKGVYIKIPKETTQSQLKDFISNKETYSIIENALNNNYPGRLKYQSPEQQTIRKVRIFKMYETGESMDSICEANRCDPRYVYTVVKEYNDKILD